MPDNIQHNLAQKHFFQGQSVQPSDLNNLQTYSDVSEAHLVSSLLGSGIVYGFTLSQTNDWVVSISPGLAFDPAGSRLVLAQEHSLDFSEYSKLKTETVYFLSMTSDFIKSDPVIDIIGDTVHTTWTPTVKFLLTESPEANAFLLASISINSSGISEINLNSSKFPTLPQIHQRTQYISSEKDNTNIHGNFTINNKTLRDLIYPIGYQYTQYPDQTTFTFNTEEEPGNLFGGIWEMQFNNEGLFFRTEGGQSNDRRADGLQNDRIRNIHGEVYFSGADGLALDILGFGACSGVFTPYRRGSSYRYSPSGNAQREVANVLNMDISKTVPTGSDNAPINRLFRIWKRMG